MTDMTNAYDVIVLGGGPTGSTTANLLAQDGHRVLVLEREVFPRFHIGESLLPCDLAVFERLGVSFDGHERHLYKSGAEFYDEARGRHTIYPFHDALTGTATHAFQVERATFDHQLLRRAAEVGAEVLEGREVVDVALGDDEVVVRTRKETFRGRYLVDATGQDSFLARRHHTRKKIDEFGLAAVFRHFASLKQEIAEELARTGNIKVLFVDEGWMWAIPLGGGRLSVGLVTRKKGIQDHWLDEEIANSRELSRLLDGAHAEGSHRRMSSFSFHNERPHGTRWVCVGDAACFLDPVFSSGVSFGMVSAAHAVDVLLPALREGREGDPGLMDGHTDHMSRGYSVFATLVLSLYQRRLLPDLFFTEDQSSALRKGLTSVLAGDVWREDNPFQQLLWSSKRRRFEIPTYRANA
jgi:flavin-dependent dehydrogenase